MIIIIQRVCHELKTLPKSFLIFNQYSLLHSLINLPAAKASNLIRLIYPPTEDQTAQQSRPSKQKPNNQNSNPPNQTLKILLRKILMLAHPTLIILSQEVAPQIVKSLILCRIFKKIQQQSHKLPGRHLDKHLIIPIE